MSGGGGEIIHLNVGGTKFSTSRQTLTTISVSMRSLYLYFYVHAKGTTYIRGYVRRIKFFLVKVRVLRILIAILNPQI